MIREMVTFTPMLPPLPDYRRPMGVQQPRLSVGSERCGGGFRTLLSAEGEVIIEGIYCHVSIFGIKHLTGAVSCVAYAFSARWKYNRIYYNLI